MAKTSTQPGVRRRSRLGLNALSHFIERIDSAVVAKLSSDVLHPVVVGAIIDRVFGALGPATITANVGTPAKDLRALDLKIANLTGAHLRAARPSRPSCRS